jgi:hypothetical protein
MIDRDLAELYQVLVKRLNEQVKRNESRFPLEFRFQLSDTEKNELVANCDRFKNLKHSTSNPYVFTEQGVAMLSAVLNSETAIMASIQIMNAFVKMRHALLENSLINIRIDRIEQKQIETDQKIEQVFKALDKQKGIPSQGVFFENQVFDAYELTSKIIRCATKSIMLIDNYIDENTITHLSKKEKDVRVFLLSKNTGKQISLDIQKANEQYGNFSLHFFDKSHDRFLIIDENEVYHLGASLKDLGKKWFAFSKLDQSSVTILQNIKEVL